MSFLIYSLLVTRYFPSMPESLCDRCAGLCCRYFALQIDNPKTARHYDDIRWYLMHENVVVYIENKKWFVGILKNARTWRRTIAAGFITLGHGFAADIQPTTATIMARNTGSKCCSPRPSSWRRMRGRS
jgi:hypothetical protein